MDTRTGEIRELRVGDDATGLTALTEAEHTRLKQIPVAERPRELAVIRWEAERWEKYKTRTSASERNAFRVGYVASLKDQRGH